MLTARHHSEHTSTGHDKPLTVHAGSHRGFPLCLTKEDLSTRKAAPVSAPRLLLLKFVWVCQKESHTSAGISLYNNYCPDIQTPAPVALSA